jgi:hypothetical protein
VPDTERHPGSALQKLPHELLNNVFQRVSTKDVIALRCTCTNLASIGLDHFGLEVTLVSHRDKFRALTEIATHPVLSVRMTSLFYMCDRLHPISFRSWKTCWPTALDLSRITDGADVNATCSAIFQSFLDACTDQASKERQAYDTLCLQKLFEGCLNIREITIACQAGSTRRLNGSQTVFRDIMATPDDRFDWTHAGVPQTIDLARAAANTGLKLDSLTLVEISHRLWDPCSDEVMSNMKALFRPLRRLRLSTLVLSVALTDHESIDLVSSTIANHAMKNFRDGRLREMLAEATDLRVLRLHFSPYVVSDAHEDVIEVQLQDILGDLRFSHLYELAISSCATTSSYLESVVLRHKETLRRLTISNIQYSTYYLYRFFQNIAGQLPNLRKITLRGFSDPHLPWSDADYDVPLGANSPDDSLVRDDFENFVLSGGLVPDWESHFTLGGADSEDWGVWIATKREDCMRPCLPKDNTMADHPTLHYAWDEFDDRF